MQIPRGTAAVTVESAPPCHCVAALQTAGRRGQMMTPEPEDLPDNSSVKGRPFGRALHGQRTIGRWNFLRRHPGTRLSCSLPFSSRLEKGFLFFTIYRTYKFTSNFRYERNSYFITEVMPMILEGRRKRLYESPCEKWKRPTLI